MRTRSSVAKRRVHQVLDGDHVDDPVSIGTNALVAGLIAANVLAVVLLTVEGIAAQYGDALRTVDGVCVAVFTAEYLLRVWACTVEDRFSHPVWGRVRFALTPYALVDLVAILPFYLPFVIGDRGAPRLLRIFRVFRILKLARYSGSLRLLGAVYRRKRDELAVVAAGIGAWLLVAAGTMYYVERTAQPEAFSSIPVSLWWAVTTLTTVGYGDVYPITPLGRALGSIIAVLGIAVFALPTAILAAGFREVVADASVDRRERRGDRCARCGARLDEPGSTPADADRSPDDRSDRRP